MGQKLKFVQSVFNKGELSPRMSGRFDNQAYYKSYNYGLNFLPFPQGSGTYRPGSVFVQEVKDSSKLTIIRPFRFSTIQNYILEFGDQYVRFYRGRGAVESGGSPYEVATPYLEADLSSLYFFQSADVLYILHPDYQPRKLIRVSDTSWTLDTITFLDGPYKSINATTTTLSQSGTTVTASAAYFSSGDVGKLLRIKSGSAWLNKTITAFTNDTTVTVDDSATISATVDWRIGVFGGDSGWPAVGSIFEERLFLGRTTEMPSTVWMSETGLLESFAPSNPTDGVVESTSGTSYTIGDDEVNSINWMSASRQILIGTYGAEYSLTGGAGTGYAPIEPTNITIKRESNYGSKQNIRVQRVGNAVLYPSQSGRKVFEMYYEFGIDSYISNDANKFSDHILRGSIVDTSYTQEPDPHFWCCLETGELVGMVYDRIDEVQGWHRHQLSGTDAFVESIASIPKPGDESDDLWLVVRRTINGVTKRYVEYLSEIWDNVSAPIDGVNKRLYARYLDSCVMYDGYYNSGITLSATTGTGVVVTAASSVFSSSDVGNKVKSGVGLATVSAYNSDTEIEINIETDFSTTSYDAGEWCVMAKDFSGLSHLEGETVSIVADGSVVDDEVVSSGQFSIDNYACVVHVGLFYSMRLVLNNPEIPSLGTIQGREKSAAKIHVFVTDSYGMKINNDVVNIEDTVKMLSFPIVLNEAPALFTGLLSMHPPSGYERVLNLEIVHDIPLPFNLNYIVLDLDVNN